MNDTNPVNGGDGHSTATLPSTVPAIEQDENAAKEESPRFTGRIAADLVRIEGGAAGVVTAHHAELRTALVGALFGSEEIALERGFVQRAVAGGPVELTRAGAGAVIAAGDVTIARGGAAALLTLGHVDIQQGCACGLVAASTTVAAGGAVGLAITPRLAVSEGGRVLIGPAGVLTMLVSGLTGFLTGWLLGRVRR